MSRVIIGQDFSSLYDPYDWCDIYKQRFLENKISAEIIDLRSSDWFESVVACKPEAFLWRVWHRPNDLEDSLSKIGILEQFEEMLTFPSAISLWSYNNKIRQHYLLKSFNVPTPRAVVTRNKAEAEYFLNQFEYPVVLKASEGACGQNVELIMSREDGKQLLEQIFSSVGYMCGNPPSLIHGIIYLQEFLTDSKDIRLITIGDTVAATFCRKSSNWRHNVSLGAQIEAISPPQFAIDIAHKISTELSLPWCAFDFLLKEGSIFLLEFSVQFGFSNPSLYTQQFGRWDAWILDKQVDLISRIIRT